MIANETGSKVIKSHPRKKGIAWEISQLSEYILQIDQHLTNMIRRMDQKKTYLF